MDTEEIPRPALALDDLERLASRLEQSPDYRVLRRLQPRDVFAPDRDGPTRTGIMIDVETTGLDTAVHEVIELGMVKFAYLPDGTITRVIDAFTAFNEPAGPIPAEITALTGITDAMVAGQRIDEHAVTAFCADAVIVIAHNAAFDRKFAERYWPVFARKAWACSASQVDWRRHGFDGSRLGYLLAGVGLFHQAHRAVDDCRALLEILAAPLSGTGGSGLATLLERARRRTVRVWAEQAPFELKHELKKRGYRWSDGTDGRPRAWYTDIDEADLAGEIAFLQTTVYLREVEPRVQPVSAFDRFSVRV